MPDRDRAAIVEEAARLVCVEQLTDYGAAKRKAALHLRLPAHTPLPDNAAVHDAVILYQQLFGGERYRQLLARMRRVAVLALERFADYQPRLVGGTVSGAVTEASRVQLHLFADSAEAVDIDLLNRGMAFEQGERSYRFANGQERKVPLLRLDLDGQGVDLAVFDREERAIAINPLEGRPFRRLDLEEARVLFLESGGA